MRRFGISLGMVGLAACHESPPPVSPSVAPPATAAVAEAPSGLPLQPFAKTVEGIMPIVALPTRIAGRNLVWRRIVARAIRADPAWRGDDYTHPPRG